MLMDMKHGLKAGETLRLSLHFTKAGTVERGRAGTAGRRHRPGTVACRDPNS
ncbi:MAG: hypothetical protein WDN04_00645 [Rhodospirillales bacterium]